VQTALQGLLKDPNKLIRGATLSALQRMTGPSISSACARCCGIRRSTFSTGPFDVVIKANHPETIRYLIEVAEGRERERAAAPRSKC